MNRYSSQFESEEGIFILIVAGALVAMLVAVGLAVDSATLFRARLALQSAVDAGAIGGTGYLAGGSVSDTARQTESEEIAEDVVLQNLEGRGLTIGSDEIAVSYNEDSDIDRIWMEVDAEADVPLYIFSLIPGYGSMRTVRAHAEAEILAANVTMYLDTSDSMMCSAEATDSVYCGCADSGTNCSYDTSKLRYLVDAAKSFLNYFDEDRDKVSLIAYNTGANIAVPFQTEGFTKGTITGAIDSLTAVGYTNPSDAFLQSYLAIAANNDVDFSNMAHVVFSDGAPTAARFWFNYDTSVPRTGHGPLPANNMLNYYQADEDKEDPNDPDVLLSGFDYYNWAYRHDQATKYRIIPGRLVPYPNSKIVWTPFNYPGPNFPPGCPNKCRKKDDYGKNVDLCPHCSFFKNYFNRPSYAWLCFRSTQTQHDGIAEFLTPDGEVWHSKPPVDIAVDPEAPTGNPNRWWKMYYENAIAMSDAHRKKGGLWFTIGLGQAAPGADELIIDPYQNVTDVWNRKDVFLRRIAFDHCGYQDPLFPGVDSYANMTAKDYRNGMSLTTTSASDLDRLFQAVAVKIKTRLVK